MKVVQKVTMITFAFLIGFLPCCGNLEGDFGWNPVQEEGISPLEEEFIIHTQYRVSRKDLYFSPNDTIYFVYIFKSKVTPSQEFFFSLNKKSIDYLEIDLRRKRIEEGDPVIRDKYKGLDIGDYMLKVAYEGEVFDSVQFQILPEDGYFTENLERDLEGSTEDEIILYSR